MVTIYACGMIDGYFLPEHGPDCFGPDRMVHPENIVRMLPSIADGIAWIKSLIHPDNPNYVQYDFDFVIQGNDGGLYGSANHIDGLQFYKA